MNKKQCAFCIVWLISAICIDLNPSSADDGAPESTGLRQAAHKVKRSIDLIQAKHQGRVDSGTTRIAIGFVVDFGKAVLMHASALPQSEEYEVLFNDGRKMISRRVRRLVDIDVAILYLDTPIKEQHVHIADTTKIKVGDTVLTISKGSSESTSVIVGTVSAKTVAYPNMEKNLMLIDHAIGASVKHAFHFSEQGELIAIGIEALWRNGVEPAVAMDSVKEFLAVSPHPSAVQKQR